MCNAQEPQVVAWPLRRPRHSAASGRQFAHRAVGEQTLDIAAARAQAVIDVVVNLLALQSRQQCARADPLIQLTHFWPGKTLGELELSAQNSLQPRPLH